jgi:CRP/FNR family cyclic AMP-dependent transcriptional regulator
VSSERITQLRSVPLFAELDDAALAEVAACASEVDFREGMLLMERGQPGSGLFVILDGVAKVELRNNMVPVGPGQVVGELGLLTDSGERSARVSAASDMRCLAISRADFARLLDEQPRLAVPMLRAVAERLRRMVDDA